MLDQLIPSIEAAKREGAIVLIKWDGERSTLQSTVAITRKDTDFVWRQDADDLFTALTQGLNAYRDRHMQDDN